MNGSPVETEADRRMGTRKRLEAIGWTHWREEHVREPHLLIHMATLITPDQPEGPLVRWQHPETCNCWDDGDPS